MYLLQKFRKNKYSVLLKIPTTYLGRQLAGVSSEGKTSFTNQQGYYQEQQIAQSLTNSDSRNFLYLNSKVFCQKFIER